MFYQSFIPDDFLVLPRAAEFLVKSGEDAGTVKNCFFLFELKHGMKQYHDGSYVSSLVRNLPGRLSELLLPVYVSSSCVLWHKAWVWHVPHPPSVQSGRTQESETSGRFSK